MSIRIFKLVSCLWLSLLPVHLISAQSDPVRIGVVGLVHDHVHWIFRSAASEAFEIAGIVEPNRALALSYCERYQYDTTRIYSTLEALIEAEKPEAVTAFNTIREHLDVVRSCAPKGIHVMVEKPLAVSLDHAIEMAKLARSHGIHLLTNYETTWYDSNHALKTLLDQEKQVMGPIRRIVVHDGHQGPQEIGVSEEFLAWLTDPYFNGAGALMDFGCYGANLSTWLMGNQHPVSITAVTQQIKPEIYPKVDDEATIIVTYPEAQTIIQASWNWNYNRKDMEVYTKNGYIHSLNRNDLQILWPNTRKPLERKASSRSYAYDDPFIYFSDVIRGKTNVHAEDLSSLSNNLVTMAILEGARISAQGRKTISWKQLTAGKDW